MVLRLCDGLSAGSCVESLVYLSQNTEDSRSWWVGLELKAAGISEGVRERLRRTGSFRLYAAPDMNLTPYTG